jgi:hypothetical protein
MITAGVLAVTLQNTSLGSLALQAKAFDPKLPSKGSENCLLALCALEEPKDFKWIEGVIVEYCQAGDTLVRPDKAGQCILINLYA